MGRNRIVILIAALTCFAWSSACDDERSMATKVTVTPSAAELTALGATVQLSAEVLDQYGDVMAGVAVDWSSNTAPAATVDASGLVTAAGNGTATITATAGAASGSMAVSVMQSAASVMVSPSADTVEIGDTLRLTAEAFDENGHVVAGAEFTWSSSDPLVATVDRSGFLQGMGEGAATITATAEPVGGSAQIDVFHPDRVALEALYRATDGPNWYYNHNWLSDAPFQDWFGVDTELGSVTGLNLGFNALAGPIPPELGNLANLTGLDLEYNHLKGSIPPELGNLANLTGLDLSNNEHLFGSIPPELGSLANLTGLDLGHNYLNGSIPPELGNLANLTGLDLGANYLEGSIPLELGNLANLTGLDLGANRLSGPIPPEFGKLGNLVSLGLMYNDLSGPIPAEFGRMVRLRELTLFNNKEMAGPLPSELTSLRQLDVLMAGGTELCAPLDPDFQTWLERVYKRRIATCGDGGPPMAYLTQAVQSREFPVPLVAEEKALLRVFVTARKATSEGIPLVRARFYLDSRETHVEDIPGKSTPIPTEVDESSLSKSANADILAEVIEPGLEMVIEVDPEGTLDEDLLFTKRIPETGRLALDIRAMPVFDLTLIPFVWSETHDSSTANLVEAIAADPENHELLEDLRTLLPIGDLVVTAHEPVLSTSNNPVALLSQTVAIRAMEGGTGHYQGMMSRPDGPFGGVAKLPGRSSFSTSESYIMAHELGHNLNLYHAPCGSAGGPDISFPYRDGSIGAWGYDFRDGGRLVQPSTPDVMSYCGPRWISDYHFTNALRFRLSDADSAGLPYLAPQTPSLLLWGGVDADGLPFLEPAFVVQAVPSLPQSGGEYRLSGRTGGGTELFSLSFTMPEVADGDGSESFAFTLSVQSRWEGSLATITLSGPGGSVTLDAGSDYPIAILLGPRDGQVRGILRDVQDLDMEQADVAAALGAGPGLEVLFSRGIPDAAAWRR